MRSPCDTGNLKNSLESNHLTSHVGNIYKVASPRRAAIQAAFVDFCLAATDFCTSPTCPLLRQGGILGIVGKKMARPPPPIHVFLREDEESSCNHQECSAPRADALDVLSTRTHPLMMPVWGRWRDRKSRTTKTPPAAADLARSSLPRARFIIRTPASENPVGIRAI